MSVLTRNLTLTWKQIGLALVAIVVAFFIVSAIERYYAVPQATSYEWNGSACIATIQDGGPHQGLNYKVSAAYCGRQP